MPSRVQDLITLVEQGYRGPAWHGTTVRGALRGVTALQALWRPGPGRHNIWELALHIAYWKYAVTRRLLRAPLRGFPREGSDWIPARETTQQAWKADVALVGQQHKLLIDAIRSLPVGRINAKEGRRWTNAEQIVGVASHDLYHTGQIQLIKRLLPTRLPSDLPG